MASHHDHAFDATRPALVLLFGNTSKKHRLLDREVIVIGRARGCDLGLDAPDISSIHCVITRGAGGFHLRDCQSRAGTKHNGNPVREVALRDGDLLQIGPFSFRVHLPAGCVVGPAAGGAGRAEHLQHSRRNLARIAMRQRKLLRLVRVIEQDNNGKAAKEQLNNQLLGLKVRIRDYDQRVRVLEDAERDLTKDRETLDREIANFRARSQQADQQSVLSEQIQAFEQEKKEFLMVREQWAKDQGAILVCLGEQKKALAQVEETLREQRQGLDCVLTALQEARPVAEGAEDGELEKLQTDNDQLRQLLALMEHEREQNEVARTAALAADPSNRSEEVAALQKLLEEKDSQLQELGRKPTDEPVRDIDTYESELNEFRRQLETDRQKLMRKSSRCGLVTKSWMKQPAKWNWKCPASEPSLPGSDNASNACARMCAKSLTGFSATGVCAIAWHPCRRYGMKSIIAAIPALTKHQNLPARMSCRHAFGLCEIR